MKILAGNVLTKIIPEKYITGDIENFKFEFNKTLNAWYYDLKII